MPDEEKARGDLATLGKLLEQPEWIERDDFYRIKVHFGKNDYAVLCVISNELAGSILSHIRQILGINVDDMLEEGKEDRLLQALYSLTQEEKHEPIYRALDEIFAQCLSSWSLKDYAKAYEVPEPECPTGQIECGTRLEIIKRLPLSVTRRILYGLLWHAGN